MSITIRVNQGLHKINLDDADTPLIGYASRRCSISWSPSLSRYSMRPISDIDEGARSGTRCVRSGKRSKAGGSGS